jgi:hypothetical protein
MSINKQETIEEAKQIQQMEDRIMGLNVDTGYRVQETLEETIEEVALNYSIYNEQINKAVQEAVKFGAKFQAERMYSEQEVFELITNCLLATGKAIKAEMKNIMTNDAYIEFSGSDLEKWFKQNKKK